MVISSVGGMSNWLGIYRDVDEAVNWEGYFSNLRSIMMIELLSTIVSSVKDLMHYATKCRVTARLELISLQSFAERIVLRVTALSRDVT